MSDLAERHAHPDGTAQRLSDEEIEEARPQIPEWQIADGKLTRDIRLRDFGAALALVNRIGAIAEQENHHPDILMYSWNRVRLELYTHTASGITENDLIMAAKFNRVIDS